MAEEPKMRLWIDPTGGTHYHFSADCPIVKTPPNEGYVSTEVHAAILFGMLVTEGTDRSVMIKYGSEARLYNACRQCVERPIRDLLLGQWAK